MEYYHNLITQRSWIELQNLKKMIDFVLIGGWAVYLYTGALKSKDIDIIVEFDKLPILGKHYQLNKNSRLNKYEAIKEDVQIDIYLPHYSNLGIPAEQLAKQTSYLEGFKVLESNYLMVLKLYTLKQRGRSVKGKKDFVDILSLMLSKSINLEKVSKIVEMYSLQASFNCFREFLAEYYEVPELGLNKHQFSKMKKEIVVFFRPKT